ncbi:MAG: thermonuclease family protein [bacterium]|nr:thermonuclease family protein [bacterium]
MSEELAEKPRSSNDGKLLVISLLLIALGLGTVWYGSKALETVPVSSPALGPTPFEATSAALLDGEEVKVVRVVDGDTVEVEGRKKVRYIGIDTPETVDPRRPVACFGKEASEENKKLVEGKTVILEKDISETDKYGRILRYVYLKRENGELLFVNDYLVRQGFAKVVTYPPDVRFSQQFLEAEREARAENRGLWGKCSG